MTESIYFGIDHRFLLDIGVRVCNVRLRLIVVVVGNEVVHRVLREEFAILLRELCSERLVVREYERRLVVLGYHIRHREGLARAGHAEERLVCKPSLESFLEFFNRLWLVARRRIGGVEFEISHMTKSSTYS